MFFFFVGINYCVLGPLTIYFSIEVKQSPKKLREHTSFIFSKPFQIMIGLFFLRTNLFLGARLGNYSLLGIFRENNDAWLFLHAALSMRFGRRRSDRNQRISWYSGFGSQLFDI
jgi:hypothetical protein